MKKIRSIGRSILIVLLAGSFLFVLGAANLGGGAGFTMALGFVLILIALVAMTIWGGSNWQFRQTLIERSKRDQQVAKAVKVGDRIELQSFIPPPIQWESVEVIAILPRARDGHVAVQVRHADGTESTQSLEHTWQQPLNRMWRPLAR